MDETPRPVLAIVALETACLAAIEWAVPFACTMAVFYLASHPRERAHVRDVVLAPALAFVDRVSWLQSSRARFYRSQARQLLLEEGLEVPA